MSTYDPREYVRLLRAAGEALTAARMYGEAHHAWRPAYSDLILLDTLRSQTEGESWWPTGSGDDAMVALVEARRTVEIPEGYWEYHDDDCRDQLEAIGRLARDTDEVCGGCGKRWPEGTGEVIECDNEGCPGACPECQDKPCPKAVTA